MYVDDAALQISRSNKEKLELPPQREQSNKYEFLTKYNLFIDFQKTNFKYFSTKQNHDTIITDIIMKTQNVKQENNEDQATYL